MADRTTALALPAPSWLPAALAPAALAPAALTLLRVGAGLLFMQHGAQKLFGLLGGVDGAGAAVPLASMMGLAGVVEFFGGLLLVLGLLTRPVALVAAAQMVAAYFMAHAPQGGLPVQNQGELALLFAVAFAFLAAIGGGAWSLDGRLRARAR